MSIQIEEGKFYRTRSGRKAGPMCEVQIMGWKGVRDGNGYLFQMNGVHGDADHLDAVVPNQPDYDLIAEWTDADEAARMELYPFTEVAWTPEDGLTSRKATTEQDSTWRGPTLDKTATEIGLAYEQYVAAVKAMPMRVQILHEGARLTHGDRDAEYGPPAVNMAAAGALKAAFRTHMTRDISLAELEAIDMALTKLGRIATGVKPKKDTFIDCATYIAIAGEIALAEWAVFIGEKKGPEV